jgi:LacI family purine nucleotide synthesis repressor
MGTPLTIAELARRLGLSTCTVSRAMNNTPNSRISAATRNRVLAEIEASGYRPNLSAQALISGKTHVVAVMIIDSNNPFSGGFIHAMEEATQKCGYHVLLCNTRGEIERERNEASMLRQRGVEGLVIEHLGPADLLLELAKDNYPFVLLAPYPGAPELDYVTFDDIEGGRLATQALLQAGRKRLAHLAGPAHLPCARNRRAGYELALREAGLAVNPDWIIASQDYDHDTAGLDAIQRLLDLPDRPDGVFCFDDFIAANLYEAATSRGLKVPEDLALIGYNDQSFSRRLAVPLASINLDTKRLGTEAAAILLRKIEHPEARPGPQAVTITPSLVWRASLGQNPTPNS